MKYDLFQIVASMEGSKFNSRVVKQTIQSKAFSLYNF